jgi:cytochrome c oxidase assembly protein subunit 15
MTYRLAVSEAPLADKAAKPLALAIWLWSVAALVFLMVVVGGATRLTESGLSITEWKPVTGVLPPLSHAAWLAEFEKYKQIPQYRELFPAMDLAQFQFIFFWEWSHRLLGRLIGVAYALPLAVFWARGLIPAAMKPKLLGILALGALQGFVGWWMVKSGLADRVEVAQERLAIHLLLASVTLAALVWLAAGFSRPVRENLGAVRPRLQWLAGLVLIVVFVQISLGALVAGLRAGLTYNTWPLMDGRFVPPMAHLAQLSPFWCNLVDNVTMVQFQHRMVAYVLLALALVQAFVTARRSGGRSGEGAARQRASLFAGLVTVQAILGILTLVLAVPLWAGLLHQGLAMLVLAAAVVHARALSAAD